MGKHIVEPYSIKFFYSLISTYNQLLLIVNNTVIFAEHCVLILLDIPCILYDCILADQVFNVTMYGELCIPVRLCQQSHTSKIVLSNSREHFHLTWDTLGLRQNVNRTYDSRTDTFYFCFRNVTEDFLFLEYCDVTQSCESGSTFCCSVWAEFVSRTRVNVAGNRGKDFLTDENGLHSEFAS